MSTEFAADMAKSDQTFYPLRLWSADFFVPHWGVFLPAPLEKAHVDTVQQAARASVDFSMGDEEVYWNIDMSERHALATWRIFDDRTKAIPKETLGQIRYMGIQLTASAEESSAADYALNLMVRLSKDMELRVALGCSDDDADLMAAAQEDADADLLDLPELRAGWLRSKTPWDLKLRSQTPDLPESAYVIFSMAYGPRTALPLVCRNLRDLSENGERYKAFLRRFEKMFRRSITPGMRIGLPGLLLPES